MTDREKLLTALLQESDRRAGAEISLLDVVAMLEQLGADHRRATQQPAVEVRPARPTRSPNRKRQRPRHDSNMHMV